MIVSTNKSLSRLYNGHADHETGYNQILFKLVHVKHFFLPQISVLPV